MKTLEVQKRMKEKGISVARMSAELHMNPSTYYRKMNKNGDEFSAADLNVFKRVLEMDAQTALDFLLS